MIVGCCTLDLYCTARNANHEFKEFPHSFSDEFGSKCRAVARRAGWYLEPKNLAGEEPKILCPKCNPKSPKYLMAEGFDKTRDYTQNF